MATKEPVPFAKQAAQFCLAAPVGALAIGMLIGVSRKSDNPTSLLIVGIVATVLVSAGLVMGIVALFGVSKHGAEGILGYVIGGMALNLMMLAGMFWVYDKWETTRALKAEDLRIREHLVGTWEHREVSPEGQKSSWLRFQGDQSFEYRMSGRAVAEFYGDWAVQGKRLVMTVTKVVEGQRDKLKGQIAWGIQEVTDTAVTFVATDGTFEFTRDPAVQDKVLADLARDEEIRYTGIHMPGWMGAALMEEGLVVVASVPDKSIMAADMEKWFTASASILQVSIRNTHKSRTVRMDPAQGRIVRSDGSGLGLLPPRPFFATARKDKEAWSTKYGVVVEVPPESDRTAILVVPKGTSMEGVLLVELAIDGKVFRVPGKFMSEKEKAEELMQANQDPPNP